MERRFTALRIVATLWKILAWVVLILGILGAIGMLIGSIAGGGIVGQLLSQYGVQGQVPGGAVVGIVGGVIVFLVALITTIFYFLILYAFGELVSLFLAIEENTRLTAQWVAARAAPAYAPPAQPAYAAPAQPAYTPPPQA